MAPAVCQASVVLSPAISADGVALNPLICTGDGPWLSRQACPPTSSRMLSRAQPVRTCDGSLVKRKRSRALAAPSSASSGSDTRRHAVSPSQRKTSVQLAPPLLLISTMPKS